MTSRALIYGHPMCFIFFHYNRVEVQEIIRAEQQCFIDLTLLSADSENMKNISDNQLFRSWAPLIPSESTLFRTSTILHWFEKKISSESPLFSADLLWISSDNNTCRWEYQTAKTLLEAVSCDGETYTDNFGSFCMGTPIHCPYFKHQTLKNSFESIGGG